MKKKKKKGNMRPGVLLNQLKFKLKNPNVFKLSPLMYSTRLFSNTTMNNNYLFKYNNHIKSNFITSNIYSNIRYFGSTNDAKEEFTDQSQERLFNEPPYKKGEKRYVHEWEPYFYMYVAALIYAIYLQCIRKDTNVKHWAFEEAHHTEERELKGRPISELYREK